jgi:hypothetical protein
METERSGSHHDSQWRGKVTRNRRLSVFADLVIGIDGQDVTLRGNGNDILVELPSVGMAFKMLRDLTFPGGARVRLSAISSALTSVGLTVTLTTPRRRLMTIGQDGNSRLLALFGFSNIRFHVF